MDDKTRALVETIIEQNGRVVDAIAMKAEGDALQALFTVLDQNGLILAALFKPMIMTAEFLPQTMQ